MLLRRPRTIPPGQGQAWECGWLGRRARCASRVRASVERWCIRWLRTGQRLRPPRRVRRTRQTVWFRAASFGFDRLPHPAVCEGWPFRRQASPAGAHYAPAPSRSLSVRHSAWRVSAAQSRPVTVPGSGSTQSAAHRWGPDTRRRRPRPPRWCRRRRARSHLLPTTPPCIGLTLRVPATGRGPLPGWR